MPAPRRHSSAGRAATLTMRPPAPVGRHGVHRRPAAQERGDEVHLDLLHQVGLRGVGDRRHGKAAGEMDRGPQLRHAGIEPRDGILLGELDIGDELDLRVVAERKALRFRRDHVGHMADGAGLDQRADHRGAERAGAAGDDDMTVAKVHRLLPLLHCDGT